MYVVERLKSSRKTQPGPNTQLAGMDSTYKKICRNHHRTLQITSLNGTKYDFADVGRQLLEDSVIPAHFKSLTKKNKRKMRYEV